MAFLYDRVLFLFFLHPYVPEEFIYSLKNTKKKGTFLYEAKKGRGSSTPWGLCVHMPGC